MHHDRGDLLGVAQAREVRPGATVVSRTIHAVAHREVRALMRLTVNVGGELGSDGATAMAPIDPVPSRSKMGDQVRPASVVAHKPPFETPM